MANIIKIKRGLKTNLPTLEEGELGYCTDTNELFVGTAEGNKIVDEKNRMVIRDEFTPTPNPVVIFPEGKKGDIHIVGDFDATDFLEETDVFLPQGGDVDTGLDLTGLYLSTATIKFNGEHAVINGVAQGGWGYTPDDWDFNFYYMYHNSITGGSQLYIYYDEGGDFPKNYLWDEEGAVGPATITFLAGTQFPYKPEDLMVCIEDTTSVNEPEKWRFYQKTLTTDEQAHFTDIKNPHKVSAGDVNAYTKEAVYDIAQAVSYEAFQDFIRKQKSKKKDTVTDDMYLISFTVADGTPTLDLVAYPYEYYAKDVYGLSFQFRAGFASAWTSSLHVDGGQISVNSTFNNNLAKNQYPNGENEGVIIPDSVTTIGSFAFDNWPANNQPLVIPNSVTTIGLAAFRSWQSNNQPLVIPDSVTTIGSNAFYYWESNNQPLVIPDSVTTIGNFAFDNWQSNNQPLVIPDSVTTIGFGAFAGWVSNNQPLVIPDSVTTIGSSVFSNWPANNQPLVIPNSVTTIGSNAFRDWQSNNQPLVIPNSVKTIQSAAFNNWQSNNQPLVIPNSVTGIGLAAFDNWQSNNQPLVIPNSVTTIGISAFRDWSVVPYIEMKRTTPPTITNTTFNNQNDAPIYVPDASVNNYKTATNWTVYASRIFAVSEKEV